MSDLDTTKCPICPDTDDRVPDSIFDEHMKLIHGDDPRLRIVELELDTPDNMTREEAENLIHMIGQAVAPIMSRLEYTENKLVHSFGAGWKDGYNAAIAELKDVPLDIAKVEQLVAHLQKVIQKSSVPDQVTPREILYLLNGRENIDLNKLEYAIAVAPSPMRFDVSKQAMVEEETWWPFTKGEILVVNDDGREPFGEQRHSCKWGIDFKYTKSLTEAEKIREDILTPDAT